MDREQAMKPRVLVVEDDPVTRAFFVEVLSALPVVVEAVARCDAAVASAGTHRHALWLLDAQLPDGDAVLLVPRLRALDREAVAIAHTASRDPGLHAALRAAGCVDVLVKPVAAGHLVETVGMHLRLQLREPRMGDWNDTGALAALGGDPARVDALRALFLAELPAAVRSVQASLAAGDAAQARAVLHRLASACALTGAGALGDAVRRLHSTPADAEALATFLHAATALSPS